jgi:hypothetical protein
MYIRIKQTKRGCSRIMKQSRFFTINSLAKRIIEILKKNDLEYCSYQKLF